MKNFVSIVLIFGLIWWLMRGKKETTKTSNENYLSNGMLSRVYSPSSSIFPSKSVIASTPTVSTSSTVSSSPSNSKTDSSQTVSSDSSASSGGGTVTTGSASTIGGQVGGSGSPTVAAAYFTNKTTRKSAFV